MELHRIVEALIFASPEPLKTSEIAKAVKRAAKEATDPALEPLQSTKPADIERAIEHLDELYTDSGRPFTITENLGGWRMVTRPEMADWIRALKPETRPERLSPPALETLAIIAYRQPVTRAAIEAVRGVAVDAVLQKIIDRGLVKIAGRADLPGRPLLYETSDAFLEHFGIKNLEDLPNSAELRQLDLPTSEEETEEEQLTLDQPQNEKGVEEGESPETPAEVRAEASGDEAGAPADATEAEAEAEAVVEDANEDESRSDVAAG